MPNHPEVHFLGNLKHADGSLASFFKQWAKSEIPTAPPIKPWTVPHTSIVSKNQRPRELKVVLKELTETAPIRGGDETRVKKVVSSLSATKLSKNILNESKPYLDQRLVAMGLRVTI